MWRAVRSKFSNSESRIRRSQRDSVSKSSSPPVVFQSFSRVSSGTSVSSGNMASSPYLAHSSGFKSSILTPRVFSTAWFLSAASLASKKVKPRLSSALLTYTRASSNSCLLYWTRWCSVPFTSLSNNGHSPNRDASLRNASLFPCGKPAPIKEVASFCCIASTLIFLALEGRVSRLRVVIKRAHWGPPCKNGLRCAAFHTSSITIRMCRSSNNFTNHVTAVSIFAKPGRSPLRT